MTEKAKELIESVQIKNFVFEDEFTDISGDYIPKSDFTRIVEQLCEEIEALEKAYFHHTLPNPSDNWE
jgi:hypothetical protein